MAKSNQGFFEPCWRPDYIDRETGKPPPDCLHEDFHFDRSLCYCGLMHNYCDDCGEQLEECEITPPRFEHDPPAKTIVDAVSDWKTDQEGERRGGRATHFACKHPYASRRTYVLDDAWVEVCRECCSARSERKDEYWETVCRLNHPDGSLRTLDGEILYRNWEQSRNK